MGEAASRRWRHFLFSHPRAVRIMSNHSPVPTQAPPPCEQCGGYTGGVEKVVGLGFRCGACAVCFICGRSHYFRGSMAPHNRASTPEHTSIIIMSSERILSAISPVYLPAFGVHVHVDCTHTCAICKKEAVAWRKRSYLDPPHTHPIVAEPNGAVIFGDKDVYGSRARVHCANCARKCNCTMAGCAAPDTIPAITFVSEWFRVSDGTHIYLRHRPCRHCGQMCNHRGSPCEEVPVPTHKCFFCNRCIHEESAIAASVQLKSMCGGTYLCCGDCLVCAACKKTNGQPRKSAMLRKWCVDDHQRIVHRGCVPCAVCANRAPRSELNWVHVIEAPPTSPRYYAVVHSSCHDLVDAKPDTSLRPSPPQKKRRTQKPPD